MAFCTKCGAILNDEDRGHSCKSDNIPAKKEEKHPTTTAVIIATEGI